jgi:hypothetical protein
MKKYVATIGLLAVLAMPLFVYGGARTGATGAAMTYPSGTGVAVVDSGAWGTTIAIGTDLQAYSDILNSIAATTPANQGLLGYKTTGGYDWYTTHQHDDSAAQFNSATASKGTLKFDQTGITDAKIFTVKFTSADTYTFTPTFTGNTGVTFPTSGTLATVGGSIGAATGTSLAVTGLLDGLLNVEAVNGKTIDKLSGLYVATGTSNFIVPTPAATGGNQYCFKQANAGTSAITVIPVHTSSVQLGKTDNSAYCTADDKLVSGGAATDQICMIALDATHYLTTSSTGVWTCTAH